MLVADFVEAFDISVSADPTEGGTVSGGGPYEDGVSATVEATPNSGWNFVNWTEGSTIVSTDLSYTFTVTSARSLVANFTRITHQISLSAEPAEGGSVSGDGVYDEGASATVSGRACRRSPCRRRASVRSRSSVCCRPRGTGFPDRETTPWSRSVGSRHPQGR